MGSGIVTPAFDDDGFNGLNGFNGSVGEESGIQGQEGENGIDDFVGDDEFGKGAWDDEDDEEFKKFLEEEESENGDSIRARYVLVFFPSFS